MLEPTSNENKVHNLTTAFTIANDHLGIPIMLDAEDMVKHKPDEKSVMTYVSFFWKAFASTKRKELAAGTIGTAIARERHLAELEAQYEDHANGASVATRDSPPADPVPDDGGHFGAALRLA